MQINLDVRQRLGLEALLGAQTGDREKKYVIYKLRKEITLSRDERRQCVREIGQGQAIVDPDAMDRVGSKSFDLEREPVRRLKDLIRSFDGPVSEMDWMEPILDQIEAAEAATR